MSNNVIAPEPTGNWNVQGKDIAFEAPIAEEFAPAQQEEVVVNSGTEEAIDSSSESKKDENTKAKFSRKEYHGGIIDNIKQKFQEQGS